MRFAFVRNSHDIATQSLQLLTKRRVVKQATERLLIAHDMHGKNEARHLHHMQ